jgi:hypothetical protein
MIDPLVLYKVGLQILPLKMFLLFLFIIHLVPYGVEHMVIWSIIMVIVTQIFHTFFHFLAITRDRTR